MSIIHNIYRDIAEIRQRIIELEESIQVLIDAEIPQSLGSAVDVNTGVLGSGAPGVIRVAPLSDVLKIFASGTKFVLTAPASFCLFKVNGIGGGNPITAIRIGADNAGFGPAVSVSMAQSDQGTHALNDQVIAMAVPTNGATPNGGKSYLIWNGLLMGV